MVQEDRERNLESPLRETQEELEAARSNRVSRQGFFPRTIDTFKERISDVFGVSGEEQAAAVQRQQERQPDLLPTSVRALPSFQPDFDPANDPLPSDPLHIYTEIHRMDNLIHDITQEATQGAFNLGVAKQKRNQTISQAMTLGSFGVVDLELFSEESRLQGEANRAQIDAAQHAFDQRAEFYGGLIERRQKLSVMAASANPLSIIVIRHFESTGELIGFEGMVARLRAELSAETVEVLDPEETEFQGEPVFKDTQINGELLDFHLPELRSLYDSFAGNIEEYVSTSETRQREITRDLTGPRRVYGSAGSRLFYANTLTETMSRLNAPLLAAGRDIEIIKADLAGISDVDLTEDKSATDYLENFEQTSMQNLAQQFALTEYLYANGRLMSAREHAELLAKHPDIAPYVEKSLSKFLFAPMEFYSEVLTRPLAGVALHLLHASYKGYLGSAMNHHRIDDIQLTFMDNPLLTFGSDLLRAAHRYPELGHLDDRGFIGGGVQKLVAIGTQLLPIGYTSEFVDQLAAGETTLSGDLLTAALTDPFTTGTAFLFGVTGEEYENFQAHYADARLSGANIWDSSGYGFETWETNGLRKFALEVAVDPFSYTNWGIMLPLKWIPVVKRLPQGFETGWNRFTDHLGYNFRKGTAGALSRLRTPDQAGRFFSSVRVEALLGVITKVSQSQDEIIAEYLPERLRGKIFTHPSEVSSQDLRDFAEASIKYVDANVDTLRGNVADPRLQFLLLLSEQAQLNLDTGMKFLNDFLTTIDAPALQSITPTQVADVQRLLNETYVGFLSVVKPKNAAEQMLELLEVKITPGNKQAAELYLDKQHAAVLSLIRRRLKVPGEGFDDNAFNVIHGLRQTFTDIYSQNSTNDILTDYHQRSAAIWAATAARMSMLSQVMAALGWGEKMGRSFARLHLITPEYWFQNRLDVSIKALAAYGIRAKDDAGALADAIELGLIAGFLPPQFRTPEYEVASQFEGIMKVDLNAKKNLISRGFSGIQNKLVRDTDRATTRMEAHVWRELYERSMEAVNPEMVTELTNVLHSFHERVSAVLGKRVTKQHDKDLLEGAFAKAAMHQLRINPAGFKNFGHRFANFAGESDQVQQIAFEEGVNAGLGEWVVSMAHSGTLESEILERGERFAKQAREFVEVNELWGPRFTERRMKSDLDELKVMPIEDAYDLGKAMSVLNASIETFQNFISYQEQLITRSLIHSNRQFRERMFDDYVETVQKPFLNNTGNNIRTALRGLRDRVRQGGDLHAKLVKPQTEYDKIAKESIREADRYVTPGYAQSYLDALDEAIEIVDIVETSKLEVFKLKDDFFGKRLPQIRGTSRESIEWTQFRNDIDEAWEATRERVPQLRAGIQTKIAQLEGRGFEKSRIARVTSDYVTSSEVGELFNIPPHLAYQIIQDDLLFKLRPLADVREEIYDRARVMAAKQDSTPEELGWTKAKIEAWYKGTTNKLYTDTYQTDIVAPEMAKWASAQRRIMGMYESTSRTSAADVGELSKVGQDILEVIRSSPRLNDYVFAGQEAVITADVVATLLDGTAILEAGDAAIGRAALNIKKEEILEIRLDPEFDINQWPEYYQIVGDEQWMQGRLLPDDAGIISLQTKLVDPDYPGVPLGGDLPDVLPSGASYVKIKLPLNADDLEEIPYRQGADYNAIVENRRTLSHLVKIGKLAESKLVEADLPGFVGLQASAVQMKLLLAKIDAERYPNLFNGINSAEASYLDLNLDEAVNLTHTLSPPFESGIQYADNIVDDATSIRYTIQDSLVQMVSTEDTTRQWATFITSALHDSEIKAFKHLDQNNNSHVAVLDQSLLDDIVFPESPPGNYSFFHGWDDEIVREEQLHPGYDGLLHTYTKSGSLTDKDSLADITAQFRNHRRLRIDINVEDNVSVPVVPDLGFFHVNQLMRSLLDQGTIGIEDTNEFASNVANLLEGKSLEEVFSDGTRLAEGQFDLKGFGFIPDKYVIKHENQILEGEGLGITRDEFRDSRIKLDAMEEFAGEVSDSEWSTYIGEVAALYNIEYAFTPEQHIEAVHNLRGFMTRHQEIRDKFYNYLVEEQGIKAFKYHNTGEASLQDGWSVAVLDINAVDEFPNFPSGTQINRPKPSAVYDMEGLATHPFIIEREVKQALPGIRNEILTTGIPRSSLVRIREPSNTAESMFQKMLNVTGLQPGEFNTVYEIQEAATSIARVARNDFDKAKLRRQRPEINGNQVRALESLSNDIRNQNNYRQRIFGWLRNHNVKALKRPNGALHIIDPGVIDRVQVAARQEIDTPLKQDMKHSAERASMQLGNITPRYDDENMVNRLMRSFFPFWTFAAHRAQFLPWLYFRSPRAYSTYQTYWDHSDNGYFQAGGFPIQASPTRGSIFLSGFKNLLGADYPEYYDTPVFREVAEATSTFEKFGFFATPWIEGALSLPLSNSQRQFNLGEPLPAAALLPFQTLAAAFPDSRAVQTLRETAISTRYERFLVEQIAAENGLDITEISGKLRRGESLTPEEEEVYDTAIRSAASFLAFNNMFGYIRFRPQEAERRQEQVYDVIEELTGLPKGTQASLQKYFNTNVFEFMGTNSDIQLALETIGSNRFSGKYDTMAPAHLGAQLRLGRERADEIDKQRKVIFDSDGEQDDLFLAQAITPQQRLARRRENSTIYRAKVDQIDRAYPTVPKTITEYNFLLEQYGITTPPPSPEELLWEILREHFTEEKFTYIDPELGGVFGSEVTDWDRIFKARETAFDAVPEPLKPALRARLEALNTPLTNLYYSDIQDYIIPYLNVRRAVAKIYTKDEQEILRRYSQSADRATRDAIRLTLRADGESLISTYESDVREARLSLRRNDPVLDANLNFWGRVQSFQSPEAQLIHDQKFIDLRRSIGRSV